MANVGLAGRWRLNEGTGVVVADSSGSALDGTLVSLTGADLTSAWIADGPFIPAVPALHFDGDSFVVVDSPNLTILEPCVVSVEARVRAQRNPGNIAYVISKSATAGSFATYAFYTVREGSDLCFYVGLPSESLIQSPVVTSDMIWDARWHHIVGTFDGRVARLYFDGNEQRPATAATRGSFITYPPPDSPALRTNYRFFIGMYRQGDDNLFNLGITADVSDVLVWRGVLSSEEVMARYSLNADLA
jgi:Concanavalin A-like lectin/glucanases superfamily